MISDVDGTITRSDLLGHVLPAMGVDWSHEGIVPLFHNIARNGYQIMFLSRCVCGVLCCVLCYVLCGFLATPPAQNTPYNPKNTPQRRHQHHHQQQHPASTHTHPHPHTPTAARSRRPTSRATTCTRSCRAGTRCRPGPSSSRRTACCPRCTERSCSAGRTSSRCAGAARARARARACVCVCVLCVCVCVRGVRACVREGGGREPAAGVPSVEACFCFLSAALSQLSARLSTERAALNSLN